MSNATVEQKPKVTVDPKLAQDIERARAAAKARQTAPAVSMAERIRTIPHKVLRDQHMKRAGLNAAEWHPFWGDRTKHDQYLEKGYVPVPDANGRHAVGEGGDLLYVLPMDLFKQEIDMAAAESRRQLRQTDAVKDAREAGAGKDDVDETINVVTVKGNADQVAAAARKASPE